MVILKAVTDYITCLTFNHYFSCHLSKSYEVGHVSTFPPYGETGTKESSFL